MELKTFGVKQGGLKYFDREGAYVVAVKDGRLAAVEVRGKGCFLPGGGIIGAETHAQCIARECLEETGCGVRVGRYIGSAQEYKENEVYGHFHPIQHFYEGELLNQVKLPIEADHTLRYIPLENVKTPLFLPLQIWAVRRLLDSGTR